MSVATGSRRRCDAKRFTSRLARLALKFFLGKVPGVAASPQRPLNDIWMAGWNCVIPTRALI